MLSELGWGFTRYLLRGRTSYNRQALGCAQEESKSHYLETRAQGGDIEGELNSTTVFRVRGYVKNTEYI